MAVDIENVPIEARTRKWLIRADTNELIEEVDYTQSELGGYADNTAHATDITAIADATIPAGKKLVIKQINITNDEAYQVVLTLYDGPSATGTLLDRFIIGATTTFGITDMVGYEATTSLVFRTAAVGGQAWSASTSLRVGGILVNT